MSYLARLKAEDFGRTATQRTDKADKSPSVSFVSAQGRHISENPAAEARRRRVLAKLADNPALRIAVVCDGEDDPVPVAVAIRDKGTCEVHIPAARFDPFALLELIERHGGTLH